MVDVVIPLIDAVEHLGKVHNTQIKDFEFRNLGKLFIDRDNRPDWEWNRHKLEKLSQPELETLWMYTKPRWL